MQHRQVEKVSARTRDVEFSRTIHMNARCRGGGQRTMPQFDELDATRIAFVGACKNLLGLEIEEAQAHCAVAHDSFEMPGSTAAAELLFGVERDDRMAALPDARAGRIMPE